MPNLQDLVADAGGAGLAAEVALRTEVRRLLETGNAGRSEIEAFLRIASPRSWITLDSSMRASWYGGDTTVVGSAASDAIVPVGLSSMAWDGHIRERAVSQLATIRNPLAGPFLAIRTTDWVTEVARTPLEVLGDPDLASEVLEVLRR